MNLQLSLARIVHCSLIKSGMKTTIASLNIDNDAPLVDSIGERLFKVTISRKNRVSLFSEAVQKLIDNREEAELILWNLRAWSPEAAAFFNLRPLSWSINYNVPFRLVCERTLVGSLLTTNASSGNTWPSATVGDSKMARGLAPICLLMHRGRSVSLLSKQY